MLETEEVDVDYFTPSTSTSLSKIFGNNYKEEDTVEHSSLKYNPQPPPQVAIKTEEPKQTQYLFAGTVFAYEWINNSYELRGRLGFAIFKIISFGIHKMVIYDSNKTTLSSLTISHNVEIKVNENISISYYDNLQKFWSVNPSTAKFKEILEILRNLKVNLIFLPAEDCENSTLKQEKFDTLSSTSKLNENEKESDTDNTVNRKTKDSILKRMATMGQSVLPLPHTTATQTSDSSDTNEPQNQQKFRHRPKVSHKKNIIENKTLAADKFCEKELRNISIRSETSHGTCKYASNSNDNQIMPIMTSNVIKPAVNTNTESSMSLFISEQRVSNGELRVTMNRVTDRLELLIDKVKDLEIVDKNKLINDNSVSQFQNDIIQKLLNEYEKKIKKYEEFIKLRGFDCDTLKLTLPCKNDSALQSLKDTHFAETKLHLEQLCNQKDEEIAQLKNELQLLSTKATQYQNYERSLLQEISDLKNNLSKANNHAEKITKKMDDAVISDITNKLKQIMNDTFQAISVHFDDEEKYSGAKIKSIVGLVVKKTTMESLKEF